MSATRNEEPFVLNGAGNRRRSHNLSEPLDLSLLAIGAKVISDTDDKSNKEMQGGKKSQLQLNIVPRPLTEPLRPPQSRTSGEKRKTCHAS
ncbi:hypothetical protein SMMN14_03561 [Sphaerulina musiva]